MGGVGVFMQGRRARGQGVGEQVSQQVNHPHREGRRLEEEHAVRSQRVSHGGSDVVSLHRASGPVHQQLEAAERRNVRNALSQGRDRGGA